ncbi:MAG: hypothetical protein JW814_03710 [Candidatus Krumholzibacteriota bacterium]|nr:hypothetical protein [Candidatus Krumholzibacteriota bacterium]
MGKIPAGKRDVVIYIALMAMGLLVISCSGEVRNADSAVERMMKAYGGEEKALRLMSYSGKGFIKKIPHVYVAESYPFDIYQKGPLFKNKVMIVEQGVLTDVRILVANKDELFSWTGLTGKGTVPAWELDLVKYRFPGIFGWVAETGSKAELLDSAGEDGTCKVRYSNGDDLITLVIDTDSWLLKESVVESVSDTSFVSRDVYGEYRNIDGDWFPGRFTGYMRGKLYYEYLLVKVEIGIDIPDSIFTIIPEDTVKLYNSISKSYTK